MVGNRLRAGGGAAAAAWLLLVSACGPGGSSPSGTVLVVAGENFWGSLAAQLGGTKATVESIVTDPNADPHEYESSADDARAFAEAGLVILNGAGYDDWGQKLLDANPSSSRRVLNVASLLGKKVGDNPHFWYSPDFVVRVANGITAMYRSIDPSDAAYFDEQRTSLSTALEPYLAEIASIKQRFAGTPVGSTESIFVYMAAALGLDLTTPPAFMDAVAEGNDPSAGAVVELTNQIASGAIKALVYNTQTTTLVTSNLKAEATARGIPTVGVSETLQPPGATFDDWQVMQLRALEAALSNPS